ncbi:MAG: chromate resistance protein [Reyranellaceae bacterium]
MTVDPAPRWLLLIHQLPAKPAYARVKAWRRLQALGAVTVKNAVYALPANDECREDFAWLAREIRELGGEVLVCEASLVEGLSDDDLKGLFEAARDEDYGRLAGEARALAARLATGPGDAERADGAAQVVRLRRQFEQVVAIDFFGSNSRLAAQGLIAGLEASLQGGSEQMTTDSAPPAGPLRSRVWVTRQQIQVDRIASAWLIRRFIDPEARFKFVPARGYAPAAGELRFDMFEGEFTHQGDRCTFEVLLAEAGLADRALVAIAEIVHDIDLKDDRYGRPETAGVKSLLAGIATPAADDAQRLARGGMLLDGLYDSFSLEKDPR